MYDKVNFLETQLPSLLAKHKMNNEKSKLQKNEINDLMTAY